MIDEKVIHDILQEADIGIWTIEIDNNKLPRMFANDTMLKLIEANKNDTPEIVYKKWFENIEKDDYQLVNNAVEEIVKVGKAEISYSWQSPKRGKTYVRCGGSLDSKYSKGIRISGYHQDITELALVKKEKEWLEKLNIDITNSLGILYDGIYRIDLEKRDISILKSIFSKKKIEKKLSYEEFLEILEKHFEGEEIEQLKDDFLIKNLKKILTQKESVKIREIKNKNNWYEYTIFFKKESEENRYLIITLKDITDRKSKEEENTRNLKEAYEAAKQANISKTSFLSRMSHDIRTPINAIIGMVGIAKRNLEDRDKVDGCLTKILKASNILLELINQVLDMSKIENENYIEKIETFNLKNRTNELSQIYCELAKKKKQDYSLRYENLKNEYVKSNIVSLQRIFTNVVSNAIKYTPKGGKIEIVVRELKNEKEDRKSYQLEVKDNGIGISKEFLKKIYEPFSREKSSEIGTGLGMSIVHNLVSILNGNIEIDSELGKGTTVYVTLELEIERKKEEKREEIEAEEERLEELNLKGKKILLVEDNELNCEIAYELLSLTGAEVKIAENGAKAVEIFKNSKIGEFDIIFMDIQMPIMDGYMATKNIRELDRGDARSIVIVAMSANAFSDDIQKARYYGMNDHIPKPIDIKKIINILKAI